MEKIIGFIGGGNMAGAIIGGILASGKSDAAHIMVSCKSQATKERLETAYGIFVSLDNKEVASAADVLFLAVKPYQFSDVIPEISGVCKPNQIVVSIAAGQTIHDVETAFGREIKLVRVMPNTPALVKEAMSALCSNDRVDADELAEVTELLESFGRAQAVPESLMEAVIGVSGSSPAYVYMMIEAMADAAVADGLPRNQAYIFAAQSVLGAAKMVLETGKHPGELKDAVCSPGGTTMEAVVKLEEMGFRSAVIEGQRACVRKAKEL